jgi:hypothetical protein
MKRELARSLARADAAQPVAWKQLCAVTRSVYASDIDDAEWAGRIKDRLVQLGFLLPRADELTRAIRAIERLVDRPPPAELRRTAPPTRAAVVPPLSRDDSARILAEVERRFHERTPRP